MKASKSHHDNDRQNETPSRSPSMGREDLISSRKSPSRLSNPSVDHGRPNSDGESTTFTSTILRIFIGGSGSKVVLFLGLAIFGVFVPYTTTLQNASKPVDDVLAIMPYQQHNHTALRAWTTKSETTVQELQQQQQMHMQQQQKYQEELTRPQQERDEMKKGVAKLELELEHQERELRMPQSQATQDTDASKINAKDTPQPSMITMPASTPGVNSSSSSSTKAGTAIPTSSTKETKQRYAYAWVLGGIDPGRPAYKGFLYAILISVHILKKLGSRSDFIVMTQLSHNTTGRDELPPGDERLFQDMGIITKHLPKPIKSSFAQLVYEKFRPLQFTEYDRIMFLDADIMPLNNLDYLFHLSEGPHPVLRPNLVVATRREPCNTGLFIMHPKPGAYEDIQGVIQRQHDRGLKLPYPHFSWMRGWGHHFVREGDSWESVRGNGNRWKFHAGHSDQGLWYYFTKYFQQDVSIVIGSKLQTVTPGPNGKPQLTDDTHVILKHAPEPILNVYGCGANVTVEDYRCNPVYRDFAHFMGPKKPWASMPCPTCRLGIAQQRWYEELREVNENLSMGLDVDNFSEKHLPEIADSPLGYTAKFSDNREHHEASQKAAASTDKMGKKIDVDASKVLSSFTERPTIAYAISLIKCGDWQTNSAGLTDASLILRHSIHKISKRNKDSGSMYDYKMYAIVHKNAETCSRVLNDAGFEVQIFDPPVRQSEIQGDFLRKTIHKEVCCGADEFIKLYAYTLPEEIIVHVDIDFAFFKPMDHLFDAILYAKDSSEGRAARQQLLLEKPADKIPDKIDIFFTRDWPQVAPNKFPAGFQAGFMVARRNPSILEEMVNIIREGNYTDGWGRGHGWHNKGYGGYVGARAMQGFVAYFYDHVRPNTHVELNHCRFNHMGMDVLYRKNPNFNKRYGNVGRCRNGEETCEDCMATPMKVRRHYDNALVFVVYVSCRKM